MSGISTALFAGFIYQPSLEVGDCRSQRRVAADSVVIAVDVIECLASRVLDRGEDPRLRLGLESREKALRLGVVVAVALCRHRLPQSASS